jgi:putative lipoic acid-binding regulatory protein
MSEPKTNPEDLVDLPAYFLFKAIVKPDLVNGDDLIALIKQKLDRDLGNFEVSHKPSKNGKYLSYSINLYVETFDEIKGVYHIFQEHDAVVMAL